MLDLLLDAPPANLAATVFAVIFGLLIGSFLNVVIHRLPKMLERQWQRECAELNGKTPDEARRMITRVNPMGRLIAPAEVAAAVGWLCSPAASGVTGQALAVAGGEV